MRHAGKIDANQNAIVSALRDIPGVTVRSTAAMGDGFPDIAVGFRLRNFLFEIKDPDKPPSKRKLTPDQVKFHSTWRGQVHVVESMKQILEIIQ